MSLLFYPSFTDDVINGIVQDKRAGRDDHTLERILCRFCALQGRYGAGVCLSHEIHMQFHTEYGFGNNTPEQFENFLKKHNYTLYVQQDIA